MHPNLAFFAALAACGGDPEPAPQPEAPAAVPVAVDIEEWSVPWADTRPRDPTVAPDGKVWFVGQGGDYLASLDPESGTFHRVELSRGTGPHNVIAAPDGTLWYAGNKAGYVGRFDPENGTQHRIAMPEALPDPHTLKMNADGDLWFTVQHGNHVAHLDLPAEEITPIPVPTDDARPYGLALADGRPWVALFGTHKLATIDPSSRTLTEKELPRPQARPRRLDVTSDGAVWYGDFAGGRLGRYDPASGEVREWVMPHGEGSAPYALRVDDQDRVWVVQTGTVPNRLLGFDPAQDGWVTDAEIPSGAGSVRNMVFHDGSLWFGTDRNTVGRATLDVESGEQGVDAVPVRPDPIP